jgi:hypothetical protein
LTENTSALSVLSYFAVAITTVNRFITTGFEGYFSIFAALSTCCREHLALEPVAAVSIALCFPCLSAGGAALGLVGITSGLEKLLFFGAEGKVSPTIGALKCFILKWHWITSSLKILVRVPGHPMLGKSR